MSTIQELKTSILELENSTRSRQTDLRRGLNDLILNGGGITDWLAEKTASWVKARVWGVSKNHKLIWSSKWPMKFSTVAAAKRYMQEGTSHERDGTIDYDVLEVISKKGKNNKFYQWNDEGTDIDKKWQPPLSKSFTILFAKNKRKRS